jgi:hypothetical protein
MAVLLGESLFESFNQFSALLLRQLVEILLSPFNGGGSGSAAWRRSAATQRAERSPSMRLRLSGSERSSAPISSSVASTCSWPTCASAISSPSFVALKQTDRGRHPVHPRVARPPASQSLLCRGGRIQHTSNRSRACRNGNWKMVSRDWRHEATSPDRKFHNLLTRDCGALA